MLPSAYLLKQVSTWFSFIRSKKFKKDSILNIDFLHIGIYCDSFTFMFWTIYFATWNKKTVFLRFDSSFFLLKGSFEKPRKKNKVFIERLIENLVLTFEIVCNDYSCLNIWAIEIYVQLVTKNVIILWNSVLFELGISIYLLFIAS